MKKTAAFVVSSLLLFVACSKDSGTNPTPPPTTPTCTGTVSYSATVNPIIQSTCATNASCHGSGSTNGPRELLTYSQVFNNSGSIRTAVANGIMPKAGSTPLTASQKNSILCWIDAGAPNN